MRFAACPGAKRGAPEVIGKHDHVRESTACHFDYVGVKDGGAAGNAQKVDARHHCDGDVLGESPEKARVLVDSFFGRGADGDLQVAVGPGIITGEVL